MEDIVRVICFGPTDFVHGACACRSSSSKFVSKVWRRQLGSRVKHSARSRLHNSHFLKSLAQKVELKKCHLPRDMVENHPSGRKVCFSSLPSKSKSVVLMSATSSLRSPHEQ